jgi:SsrA-binding protein
MSDYSPTYADNRQARFNYEILETYEAGVELLGTEVKAIRGGQANLRDAYAIIREGELLLLNVYIAPHHTTSTIFNHSPTRTRKLLLHRKEILKLVGKVEQKGLTLVPLRIYLKNGWIKVSIALARSKKLYDKREDVRKREDKRDIARIMKMG